MEPESEYSQSVAITFEWTLRGLKDLFESSKGEAKSKTTKSVRFGGGRWQILFYANSGTTKEGSSTSDSGGYISLYLSCEPTQEEKDAAAGDGGKWIREGVYQFSFELKNLAKTITYNLKEAHNHTFSHKTANWGWAQFAKRDNVYFNSNGVKNQDAFVIKCTITSSPAPPTPSPTYRTQSVPKRLLETVGALLNDPLYSDVEFVIPGRGGEIKSARKILASKTLLRRAEYFESMFGSSFSEGSSDQPQASVGIHSAPSVMDSEANLVMNEFEDSDDEDDQLEPEPEPEPEPETAVTQIFSEPNARSPSVELEPSASAAERSKEDRNQNDREEAEQRNVRAKLSHPSSPRSNAEALPPDSGKSRSSVVVKDVAYNTYMALLYYLYTDIIVFAPLSSTFISKSQPTIDTSTDKSQSSTLSEEVSQKTNSQEESFATRRQWIHAWKEDHPELPAPCSAKAMFRLADRIDLPELKIRASQHIVKSLTIENIAYEIFTPFAAAFDDIRKIQVDFFLAHWKDIRASDSMRNVWQQIRNGRHPGFEEVWPVIASNLEFKPSQKAAAVKPEAAGDNSR